MMKTLLNTPAWAKWTAAAAVGLVVAWLLLGAWLLLVLVLGGLGLWWSGWVPQRIAAERQAAACLVASGIRSADGEAPALRLSAHASGWLLTVSTPVGKSDAEVFARADALASALRAHSVVAAPALSAPGRPAFLVSVADNLADVVEHPAAAPMLSAAAPRTAAKDLRRCDIGVSALGGTADLNLPGSSLLIAGSPGSGKSVAAWSVLLAAASDPAVALVVVDLKPSGIETLPIHKCAEVVATTDVQTLAAFRRVWAFIESRNAALAADRLEKATYPGHRPVVVFVDEAAELAATDTGKAAMELLRRIVSVGRASLVTVVLCTQKPEGRLIDTNLRDLFAGRVCMRVGNRDQAGTVLGDLPPGVTPWTIPTAGAEGVGYYTDGGTPVKFRAYNLTRPVIVEQANRAHHLRALVGTSTPLLPPDPGPAPAKRQRRRRESGPDDA